MPPLLPQRRGEVRSHRLRAYDGITRATDLRPATESRLMSSTETSSPTGPPAVSRRAVWVLGTIGVVFAVGMIALIVWAISSRDEPTATVPAPSFDRFQVDWSSAMLKAGVEATFPAGPVEITEVRATGQVPFEAEFTADEISALVNVYLYGIEEGGPEVALSNVSVAFPRQGVGSIEAKLVYDGAPYDAFASAPLTYSAKGISSPGLTSLKVEGFSVGGSRRKQAGDALLGYLNSYLKAAPGLTVEQAQIVSGGLKVKGTAPAQLEHPEPIEP